MMWPRMPPTPPEYLDFELDVSHKARLQSKLSFKENDAKASTYKLGQPEYLGYLPRYGQHMDLPAVESIFTHGCDYDPQHYEVKAASLPVANAPVLPPIKHLMDDQHYHQASTAATKISQVKEEKTTGGVAAHLDYEMDSMVDFVSETVHGLHESYISTIYLADIDVSRSVVNSKTPVSSDFRNFVSQILSSTRLPSSTILLGLCYLVNRLTTLSSVGVFNCGEDQLHRMLTVSLLLGSKFLDDNTFQNRSWSEVSNIPVSDLNVLEREWLEAFEWELHLDIEDSEGFLLWHQRWLRFLSNKAAQMDHLAQVLQQMHLEKKYVPQHQRVHQSTSPSNYKFIHHGYDFGKGVNDAPPFWAPSHYEPWPSSNTQIERSPPSAPETGPNTPVWYDTSGVYAPGCIPQASLTWKLPPPLQVAGCNPAQIEYQSQHAQQYNQYSNNHTRFDGQCRSQYLSFPPPGLGYGPQYVIG